MPVWGGGPWGGFPWSGGIPPPAPSTNPPVVTGKGWGLDSYGTSPYGSNEAGVGISVVAALAISTNSVLVVLSGRPQAVNQAVPGDALNPLTWMIQRTDNGFIFNIASVQISTPTEFIISVLESFGPANVTHVVSSSTLLDQSGNPLLPPQFADFSGIVTEDTIDDQLRGVSRGVFPQDLANPQTPGMNVGGGTLRLTSGGDYDTETGDALYKKLVIRRLTSRPGDFFHLPDYGIDLPESEPVTASDLIKLKKQVEQQVQKEPETDRVVCTPTIDANGIAMLNVAAKSKISGNVVSVSVPANPQALGAP